MTEAQRLLEIITSHPDAAERESARIEFYESYSNQGCIDGESVEAIPALIDALPRMPERELEWLPFVLWEMATAHYPDDPGLHARARGAIRLGIPIYVDLLWHEDPGVTESAAALLAAFPADREAFATELLAAVEHECDAVNAAKLLSAAIRGVQYGAELDALLVRSVSSGRAPLDAIAALGLVERSPNSPDLDEWLRRLAHSYHRADGPDRDAVVRALAPLDPARVVPAFVPVMRAAPTPYHARTVGEFLLWLVARQRLGAPPASTLYPLFRYRQPQVRYPEPNRLVWLPPTGAQRAMLAEHPERYANCGRSVSASAISNVEFVALETIALNRNCWASGWDAPSLYGFPVEARELAKLLHAARS